LKAIEDGLLHYIFKKREQGIKIKVFTVVLRASFMLPEFRKKSFTVRCSCVKRFMHAHSFSYRMGTHTSQRPPVEVESKAFDFMRFMRIIVSGGNRDRRFIINMDQTPVYFLMSSKRTLEVIEKKTIHICTSTNDTKRVTMAVTITVDGTLLPSTLVFQGEARWPHFKEGVLNVPQDPLLQMPGSCLDGRGGNDRVGERGVGIVRCDGSGSRCPHPDPRHVPMPHDAIGSANDT
jgi:hypothetical protein